MIAGGVRVWVGLSVGVFLVAGCGGQLSPPPSGPNGSDLESTLVGHIEINGSSTVQPISDAIREAFIQVHPNVNITVRADGTGHGFENFYGKSTDISDASRPIQPGEYQKVREAGIDFLELAIAYDGLTICVNPANTWVESLTIDQLKRIFVGDAAARTWQDVDASWPAREIKIFAPGTGSGTYDYFRDVVTGNHQSPPQKSDLVQTDLVQTDLAQTDPVQGDPSSGNEFLRGDMTLNESDNVLVQGVAGNKNSIGFFGVSYYAQNTDILRAIPIVNPETGQARLPTTENIASNRYAPFSRPLFLYVSLDSLNRAEVQTFVDFYLTNVSQFCADGKVLYVQLPDEIFSRTRAIFDSVRSGTHYIDPQGNARRGSFAQLYQDQYLRAP